MRPARRQQRSRGAPYAIPLFAAPCNRRCAGADSPVARQRSARARRLPSRETVLRRNDVDASSGRTASQHSSWARGTDGGALQLAAAALEGERWSSSLLVCGAAATRLAAGSLLRAPHHGLINQGAHTQRSQRNNNNAARTAR